MTLANSSTKTSLTPLDLSFSAICRSETIFEFVPLMKLQCHLHLHPKPFKHIRKQAKIQCSVLRLLAAAKCRGRSLRCVERTVPSSNLVMKRNNTRLPKKTSNKIIKAVASSRRLRPTLRRGSFLKEACVLGRATPY